MQIWLIVFVIYCTRVFRIMRLH